MEYQIKSKLLEDNKNLINYNNIYNPRNNNFEENKNYLQNNKYNPNINSNYNLNKLNSSRNTKIYPLLPGKINSYNPNFINDNRTIFRNKNHFNDTLLINSPKNDKKYNYNFKTLERNSSFGSLINNRIKKIDAFRGLNRNKSTAELLNQNNLYILPLIKPRKIIINYCCGPYELHVTDINKKNLNCKQYGHNTFFMGENYNPQNYEIKQKNRISRNYYGKLFSK